MGTIINMRQRNKKNTQDTNRLPKQFRTQLGKDKKEIARALFYKYDYDTKLIADILCCSEQWVEHLIAE